MVGIGFGWILKKIRIWIKDNVIVVVCLVLVKDIIIIWVVSIL